MFLLGYEGKMSTVEGARRLICHILHESSEFGKAQLRRLVAGSKGKRLILTLGRHDDFRNKLSLSSVSPSGSSSSYIYVNAAELRTPYRKADEDKKCEVDNVTDQAEKEARWRQARSRYGYLILELFFIQNSRYTFKNQAARLANRIQSVDQLLAD